ncbi:hypothetical protein, variant [Verruconis gallopava]|uniref:PPIase cyclophilin-type domain-containing protein n=1 Tax=Verruconis gallopava TaxID=253628 RepID=A0A0D2AHW1_9PEZI|nr:hypothetical protein, variant [Verruconis gallopava]KIW06165.1 hypothetical protein, variant [Verruconis gallopava]
MVEREENSVEVCENRFFITLRESPHLNAKHTIFGMLVEGKETLNQMAKVPVDKEDRPLTDVIVAHCGELEYRRKPVAKIVSMNQDNHRATVSSTSRGRHKRRHSSSRSRSRSPSPSRGHGRRSGSRHRHRHRRHKRDDTMSRSRSPTPPIRVRRRSDASPDHTFRGRERRRSGSRTPIRESDGGSPEPERKSNRKRSSPPSRPWSCNSVPGREGEEQRRQRSLPNQYRKEDVRIGEMQNRQLEKVGGNAREGSSVEGVVYRGRGLMKYHERRSGW